MQNPTYPSRASALWQYQRADCNREYLSIQIWGDQKLPSRGLRQVTSQQETPAPNVRGICFPRYTEATHRWVGLRLRLCPIWATMSCRPYRFRNSDQ